MPWRQRLTHAWLQRGPWVRALLPLSWLYGGLSAMRVTLFRWGWLQAQRLPVPVIVIGNRIAGGAGKTPTTIAVVQHLQSQGWRVGVVSRGYGRSEQDIRAVDASSTAAEVGDEPLLIWRRCGVPVFVGRARAAAGRALLAAHPQTQILLTDDGLQHLQLARDLEVIVFDERGAGNGWLLPAGPLRESVRANPQACRQVVLYSAGHASTDLPGYMAQRELGGFTPLPAWLAGEPAQACPAELRTAREPDLIAAAGIAVPQRFFDQLTAMGLRFTALALPDHHDYATLPWPVDTPHVIVTEKDAVKIANRLPANAPQHRHQIWVARLNFQAEPAFFSALDDALPPRPEH